MIVDVELKRWATPKQAAYIESANLHGSYRAAAKALGVRDKDGVRKSLKSLERRAAMQGYAPESDMVHVVPSPYKVRGTSTLYDKDGKVSQQWVKTRLDDDMAEDAIKAFVLDLVESARGLSPLISEPKSESLSKQLLTVYPVGDPHFGLYTWADECGENFDLKTAEADLTAAIDRLVSSAPATELAILAELGDLVHSDNESNRTTRSGHALDVDGRYAKIMQVALRALIHGVLRMLEKHQRVIVRIVKGNHDDHSSLAIALAIDAYFQNNERVQVDLPTQAHWFYQFGKVMLGVTHGDTTKMNMLPGVMAADQCEMWGQTRHRYWLCGHVHHDKKEEFPGVTVEYFRTLAPRDAWHSASGYRAGRDMKCIVYHETHGEVERHRCDIGMIR